MAQKQLPSLIRHLHRSVGRPGTGVLDAELLERFVNQRDEAAFELLMWRHERMVLGVCRRLLRRQHDAEEAFQATFLALACKAGSIGKREAVASWLYKVAFRIALRERANRENRTRHERQAVFAAGRSHACTAPENDLMDEGLCQLLHEEVSRLPEKYRAPVILCYLEGRTNEEAARQLRCPTGTVVTWLARARKRLHARLLRRGIAPSAAFVAMSTWTANEAWAAAPACLRELTVRAALVFALDHTAAGLVSARVAALTRGVLKTMMITKLKLVAAVVLCIGLVGTGSGVLAYRNSSSESLIAWPETPAGLAALRSAAQDENPAAPNDAEPRDEKPDKKADNRKESTKDVTARDVVTRTFTTKKAPRVVVELYNGAIEVDANAESGVDARVTKEGRGKTEEAAKEALKSVDVTMTQEGDTIRIHATRTDDEHTRHHSGASAHLKVPPGATLELQTKNGSVAINGGTGSIRVGTANGKIQTKSSKGPLDLSTSNGEITVTGATSPMKLKTTNGPININSEGALVTAATSNGAVHFQGTLAAGENSLRTNNGGITVTLPADARFRVIAETSHGKVTSDFSGERVSGKGRLRLSTSVGRDPSVSIQLHTSNGSIAIRRQEAK